MKKQMKPVMLSMVASTLFIAINANANVSLGLGVGYSTQPYLGVSNDVVPLPIVNFENEHFFIKSTKAGYFLWNDGQQKVNLNISYNGQSFRGRDSNDNRMRTLDRRQSTAMMGIGYDLSGVFGAVSADLSGDILNRSNGLIGDLNYSYPITNDLLTVAPSAGVNWNSGKFNDYHFGVSGNEATRSTLDAYKAGSGISPYMGVNLNYRMTDNWSAFGMAQHKFLSSQIKDSPMISSSGQSIFGGGFSYTF
ncbi:MipA/OmpV family protein [Thorsellia anophelis]|uniref:Outer membrane protein n=1 Tax=Thorsellia anophelis DSM 18579 TaxID=1123402 RepID=A0A1I0EKR8_9GAMM|nr:MipA/OmpV family protein [Thorsellia anophelis]SET45790.1 outer membrane protein [Thorsellia anophelis DSM 18579]